MRAVRAPPQGADIEYEAHPIAEKSHHRHGSKDRPRRPPRAEPECDNGVCRARHEALEHRDLDRIAGGDLLREVVVHRPGEASRGNRERAHEPAPREAAFPGKEDAPGNDRGHAKRDAPVHVLPKHEPRQRGGEHAFQVQQQRCTRCGGAREPQHEQQGTQHSARQDRTREPWQIRTTNRRLMGAPRRQSGPSASKPQEQEPCARAKIEQTGQELRTDRS